MSRFMPNPVTMLIMILAAAAWIGLAALGWGSLTGLLYHPARAGACLLVLLTSLAAGFTQANAGGLERARAQHRWLLLPALVVSILLVWLPPYTDRRQLWTIDGDAIRYL